MGGQGLNKVEPKVVVSLLLGKDKTQWLGEVFLVLLLFSLFIFAVGCDLLTPPHLYHFTSARREWPGVQLSDPCRCLLPLCRVAKHSASHTAGGTLLSGPGSSSRGMDDRHWCPGHSGQMMIRAP